MRSYLRQKLKWRLTHKQYELATDPSTHNPKGTGMHHYMLDHLLAPLEIPSISLTKPILYKAMKIARAGANAMQAVEYLLH